MKNDTSGPAFPIYEYKYDIQKNVFLPENSKTGMSMRDWFAGQALSGINACADELSIDYVAESIGLTKKEYDSQKHWPIFCANRAYAMADAMLKEREQ